MNDLLPRYAVTDLGILPGFESSRATGLNDRGQVIGSLSREEMDLTPNGFLWAEGAMRKLGGTGLTSINNRGQIVGYKHPQFLRFSAALYGAGRFTELLKNTSAISMALCINDCGQVVGWLQSTNWKSPAETKRGCFLWENGKRRYLDIPEGYHAGEAAAVNNNGVIVGRVWRDHPNDEHAIVWNSDLIELLDEPSEFNESWAVGINNRGQILIRAVQSNLHDFLIEAWQGINFTLQDDTEVIHKGLDDMKEGLSAVPGDALKFRQQSFLWQNGDMTPIEGLAEAVNDQGQVVGWSGCALSAEELAKGRKAASAFLWQNGEAVDLNDLLPPDSGWQLTKATDINNNGQIVGHGKFHGNTRAFLLTPIIN